MPGRLDLSEEDGPFVTWLIRIAIGLVLLFGAISTCSYREAEQECEAVCKRREFAGHSFTPSSSSRVVTRSARCYCLTEEDIRKNTQREENRVY